MPIYERDDDERVRLGKARKHYSDVLAQLHGFRGRQREAYRFATGDQWPEDVKSRLRARNQPVLVANHVQRILRNLAGANEDTRRQARVQPVGNEDLPTSQVANFLWDRAYMDAQIQNTEQEVFLDMITGGVGYAFIDAQPDEEQPDQLHMSLEPIDPFEVLHDPASKKVNFADGRFFYWSRWYSEADFKAEYPEHADKFDELVSAVDPTGTGFSADNIQSDGRMDLFDEVTQRVYYDPRFMLRDKGMLRVIHLEHEFPTIGFRAFDERPDPTTGQPMGWRDIPRNAATEARRAGIDVQQVRTKEWRWTIFSGLQMLYDDTQPLDIGRPQILAARCFYDKILEEPYGIVRDLIDPQQEVNKRQSQEVSLIASHIKPKVFVKNIGDLDEFAAKLRTADDVAGVPAQAELQFAPQPKVDTGLSGLSERSLNQMQTISGVDVNPFGGLQPENMPVGTALLSYRRSLQAIRGVLENFRDFQRVELKAVVRTILRHFEDSQIEQMLGDSDRFNVGRLSDGALVIQDVESQQTVQLSFVRTIRYNVEMDSAAQNTTDQLLRMQTLLGIQGAGIPVDPEVFYDSVPLSGEDRQKLKNYAQEQAQVAAMNADMMQKLEQQRVGQVLEIEQGRTVQRQAEAEGKLAFDAFKAQMDNQNKKLELLLEALGVQIDAAEAEVAADVQQANAIVGAAKTFGEVGRNGG